MGVAGSGKSTVGPPLAERIVGTYIDGDQLHPASNIRKMSAGIPLPDADREPWLLRVIEDAALAVAFAWRRLQASDGGVIPYLSNL